MAHDAAAAGYMSVNWADAIRDVRDGAALPRAASATLVRGLRLLMAKRLKPVLHESVVECVLSEVEAAIRSGAVVDAQGVGRTARCALEVLVGRHAENTAAECPPERSPEPSLLAAFAGLPPLEREALRQYYTSGRDAVEICRDCGITLEALAALRSRLRERTRVNREMSASGRMVF